MSNNCLVTKLKGVVDNDSLPYYNQFLFHVSNKYPVTADTQKIGFGLATGHEAFEVRAKGNGSFKYRFDNDQDWSENYVNTITVPATANRLQFIVHEGDYDVLILGKYYLLSVNYVDAALSCYKNISFDISQLNYNKILNLWTSGFPFTGTLILKDASELTDCDLNLFNANAQGNPAKFSYGVDIDSLSSAVNMTRLNIRDTASYGSIESLGRCTSLELIAAPFADIEGEVIQLAESQVANGRTSGVLQMGVCLTKCTLNGNPITYALLENHWDLFIVFDSTQQGGYRIQYTQP